MKNGRIEISEIETRNSEDINGDAFNRALKLFALEPDEAGVRYNRLHSKLVGFFTTRGIADPVSAADETFNRAVLKIDEGAIVPDLERFCFGIARYVSKESVRVKYRENLAFHQFMQLVSNSSTEHLDRIHEVLKPCFEQLSAKDQEMLRSYCGEIRGRPRAEHRRELAKTMMVAEPTLRVRVNRLRDSLRECVKQRSLEV